MLLGCICMLFFGFLLYSSLAQTESIVLAGTVELTKGKNNVMFQTDSLYVQDLIAAYPSIETVSYYDSFLGTQLGYVNVFGGVGRNFLLVPGQQYEIVLSEDTIFILPS